MTNSAVTLLVVSALFCECAKASGELSSSAELAENSCRCVPQELCRDDVVLGTGLLDIRLEQGKCQNYFEVCCENPVASKEIEMAAPNLRPSIARLCGTQTALPMDVRITSDSQTANFGELPWSVAVLLKDPDIDAHMYRCGGSLIHHRVVLTAAHCVAEATGSHWIVRAGEWDTLSRDEPLPHQDRVVQEVIIHQLFNPGTLKYDTALLILSDPVIPADNVGFVCLPNSDLHLDHTKCTASGWGKDAFKTGKHSTILKMVELPLVHHEDCQNALRKTRLGKFYHLHRSFVCAGGEPNKDTCKGDGGSPLVCPIPGQAGRFVQMGIVSWGIGCGDGATPGVYANVQVVRRWIDKQLSFRNFNVSVYSY